MPTFSLFSTFNVSYVFPSQEAVVSAEKQRTCEWHPIGTKESALAVIETEVVEERMEEDADVDTVRTLFPTAGRTRRVTTDEIIL
jgi:hypothetical protein